MSELKIYHVAISDRAIEYGGHTRRWDIQATGQEEAIDQAARMFVAQANLWAFVTEPEAWKVIREKQEHGISTITDQLQESSGGTEVELVRSKYDRGDFIQLDRVVENIKGALAGASLVLLIMGGLFRF